MEFGDHDGGYHFCRRVGHSSGGRNEPDSSCFGRYYRLNDSHGNGCGAGVDCGDAGESFNCKGRNRTVHGDGNVVGWFHAKLDRHGCLEFGDHQRGYHFYGRAGNWSGGGDKHD